MTHAGRILGIASILLHLALPSLAHAQACPHQGLARFGPLTPATFDYPAYYVDQTGLGLAACQDPAAPICAVVTGPLPNPAAPADIAAGNFFAEFPYTFINATVPMPGGGIGLLVYSVLGTFAPVGDVVPGTQVVFGRVRFRIDTPAAGTYTMTHPFGVTPLTAAAPGRRSINFTDDCLLRVPATCGVGFNAFTTPLDPSSFISTWLRWDATPPAPPAGYIGDFAILHPITGSPCGTNFFRVEGPGRPPPHGGVQRRQPLPHRRHLRRRRLRGRPGAQLQRRQRVHGRHVQRGLRLREHAEHGAVQRRQRLHHRRRLRGRRLRPRA